MTSPARTLTDLTPFLAAAAHERAVNEAEVLRLVPITQGAPGLIRSEAERRLVRLLRRAGLGDFQTNVQVAGLEVDVWFAERRVAVEIDGYAYHRAARAFERDRLRDAQLHAAGVRVIRVTWRQIVEEPEALVARLAAALAYVAK